MSFAALLRVFAPALCLALAALPTSTAAAQPAKLRVNVFPGAQNLPLYIGMAHGVFARHGIELDLQFTPNSQAQRDGLAQGRFDIAHAAVDNAVAMVETAGADVIIVMGGDSSMNEFFLQSDLARITDVKGKALAVDAPNTAYALVARKILQDNGLKHGDYTLNPVGGTAIRMKAMIDDRNNAAGILNIPFSIIAKRQGLRSVGRTVDILGPYQATGAWVLRSWATANADLLERYLAAYVEALRLALAPAQRGEAIALLAKWLKLDVAIATETYELLREPTFGLTPDARFDLQGFRNLLALRAEIEGAWGGKPPAPEKYYDLRYYEAALKRLPR